MAQQAVRLRSNEQYNNGASGLASCFYKYEFDAAFTEVQINIGSRVTSGTPGEYKVQVAVTDEIGVDTITKAFVPMRGGVAYNDKSEFGWKDCTFSAATSKRIGLAPNVNFGVIHMPTDLLSLASVARADGKPGGILLVKIVQTDAAGAFTQDGSGDGSWIAARGQYPWFREAYNTKRTGVDAIATLTSLPTSTADGSAFMTFPIVNAVGNANPAELLMFTGDSRTSASGSSFLLNNPNRQAAMSLSTSARPISTVNAAGSGHSQTEYLRVATDLIASGLRPTIIYLPGFSQNGFVDFTTFKTKNDEFMASVRAIAGLENVKFVLNSDYYVSGYNGNKEAWRLECIAYAKSLVNGTTVFFFDSDPIITDYSTPSAPVLRPELMQSAENPPIHANQLGQDYLTYGAGSKPGVVSTYKTALANVTVVLPGAPAIGTATAGNGSVTVSFTPPVDNGGSAILDYTVTAGGISATGTSSPITVSGVPAGTAVTATVRARNSAGSGPASLASNSVTPTEVPVTPTVTSVTVSPSTATGSTTFSAVVAGTNSPSQAVTWAATAGSISTAGVFTAPAATSSVQNITVTATSVADTSKSGTAAVTIAASATPTVTAVTVSPSTATGSTTFTATVTGTNSPSQAVTWTASAGAITSSGVFTAPAATISIQNITITARSVQDNTKAGTAAVTIASSGDSSTAPPTFVRSTSRTIIIGEVPGSFEQDGRFWNLANPKKPTGSIDPNSIIDITFDWTRVLADIDARIADIQFDILGLTDKGGYGEGAFATIFVSNATGAASITCRITTDSIPPRIEDRTVFLTVEQH